MKGDNNVEGGPARQMQMIVTVAFNHHHCLQLDVPLFQNRVSTLGWLH